MICEKCGKKLQMIKLYGIDNPVFRMCDCEKEEQEKIDEHYAKSFKNQELKRKKLSCFSDSDYSQCLFCNDDGKSSEASKIAKNYCKNFDKMKKNGSGLLFLGKPRTGKTFLAACMANELIEDYSVFMIDSVSFVRMVQNETYDGQRTINKALSCGLFILDDFGSERGSEYVQEQMYSIIDGRYRSRKPIIITSNIAPDDFVKPKNTMQDRIHGRIIERCFPVKVECENRSKKMSDKSYIRSLLDI